MELKALAVSGFFREVYNQLPIVKKRSLNGPEWANLVLRDTLMLGSCLLDLHLRVELLLIG